MPAERHPFASEVDLARITGCEEEFLGLIEADWYVSEKAADDDGLPGTSRKIGKLSGDQSSAQNAGRGSVRPLRALSAHWSAARGALARQHAAAAAEVGGICLPFTPVIIGLPAIMQTVLIAYDGSEGADAVFTEMQRAGLPEKLSAQVVAVADYWKSPGAAAAAWVGVAEPLSGLATAGDTEAEAVRWAGSLAGRGAERVRALFPGWEVTASGAVGSVARSIVQRAAEIQADLILIGSHSRSAVGRFFLGSVSQRVAAEAQCSVRICRSGVSQEKSLPRVIVAIDGSRFSEGAVRAVAERSWPRGTSVAVINVIEPALRQYADLPADLAAEIQRQHEARLDWLESIGSAAKAELERAGLTVERHVLEGEPKSTLLEWAERWKAECLFIGAAGLHHFGTATLGTVASALAVRAHCSVEIVR